MKPEITQTQNKTFENLILLNIDQQLVDEAIKVSELLDRIELIKNQLKKAKKVSKETYRKIQLEYLDLVKIL